MTMRFLNFLFLTSLGFVTAAAGQQVPYSSATISGLGARNIGSAAMSGRVSAIAATRETSGKLTIFVGAASGGVWKSEDSGTVYRPVFDEQPVQSIGAIALDPKNSKNVWVGTGEPWTRNSVSIGDGIYKSTDGGETWDKAGLPNSERISQIIVSPQNSDTVYVAAPGALWVRVRALRSFPDSLHALWQTAAGTRAVGGLKRYHCGLFHSPGECNGISFLKASSNGLQQINVGQSLKIIQEEISLDTIANQRHGENFSWSISARES